ncbi:MAG: site-specific integrase [Deltaproteobacteria bacterium]|nr:site-specific integrase [Deltaproteobacteria bacterium]
MSKRRGRGEGSIFKRGDGVWCATITAGYDENGKRRRAVLYGDTKQAVQEKLVRAQSQMHSGTFVRPDRMSVAEFLKAWLENSARPSVRKTTYTRYESVVRVHLVPRIGGIALAKLDPATVQAMYAQMERDGASARACEMTHLVLHRALKQALKWTYVARNVCDSVDKPRSDEHELNVFSIEQVGALLRAAESDRLHALYVLAIDSGMRQGEIFGLQWADVDLKVGAISVSRTLVEVNGEIEPGEPKSKKGKRRIDISHASIDALREHRKRMFAEGLSAAPWVFCDSTGGPLRKSNFLRRSFHPILKRAGLPHCRFHDLRHSSAVLMLSEGVHPKVAQERLGHSQIGVTMNVYTHVLPSMQREVAAKFDRVFQALKE